MHLNCCCAFVVLTSSVRINFVYVVLVAVVLVRRPRCSVILSLVPVLALVPMIPRQLWSVWLRCPLFSSGIRHPPDMSPPAAFPSPGVCVGWPQRLQRVLWRKLLGKYVPRLNFLPVRIFAMVMSRVCVDDNVTSPNTARRFPACTWRFCPGENSGCVVAGTRSAQYNYGIHDRGIRPPQNKQRVSSLVCLSSPPFHATNYRLLS